AARPEDRLPASFTWLLWLSLIFHRSPGHVNELLTLKKHPGGKLASPDAPWMVKTPAESQLWRSFCFTQS
ncbi:MAG TPA: hypothetical protein VF532_22780, partial [Candidatus Angelobacter sp.]